MKETWAILDSGLNDAATNMAIDEALLKWHSEGLIRPTIRFYGWTSPSLSVGQFQHVEKTIDFAGVEKHACDVVRRLTGGSAVLHDDEITYSIVVSESHPKIPRTVNQAYYALAKGLLKGYHALGIDAQFAISERELRRERSAVCFEKPAIYEMIVAGKKISGNAQLRKNGVLLQHGSIPMSFDATMLFDLFQFSSDRVRERQRRRFLDKAVSIHELTDEHFTFDQLRDVFLKGFEDCLDIQTEPFHLSNEQWNYITYVADTKYRTDAWNKKAKKRSRSV